MKALKESLLDCRKQKTFTGFSSTSAMDIRNKAGQVVGEFQAITWIYNPDTKMFGGQIVLIDKKDGFNNENLTICLDWIPNPRFATAGEPTYGYTLINAHLLTDTGITRALESYEIEANKIFPFIAEEVTPYIVGEQL